MYILKLRSKIATPTQVKNKSPIVLVIKLIAEKPREYIFPFFKTM